MKRRCRIFSARVWAIATGMVLLVTAATGVPALAQQSGALAASQPEPPPTPEQQAAAVAFAREHHPELADLLGVLQSMDAGRYEAAVQELVATSQQLARIQERAPERYAVELELWKIDSRIRLLVARSTMEDPEELRGEIKRLLLERNQVRIRQIELERTRLINRAEKLGETIANLTKNADASAEREVQRLLKSVQPAAKKGSATTSKPGNSSVTQPVKAPARSGASK